MTPPRLILGSTSRYRRELLARLRLPFEVQPPAVDETPQRGEMPCAMSMRLAREKARAVAKANPSAVVIGADQVADLDGQALGKPGDRERAAAQLRRLSGQRVVFHTALSVVRADIDYGEATAMTTYGTCGIKVWVFKGEILAHDPMAQEKRLQEAHPGR